MGALLDIRDLSVSVQTKTGSFTLIDGIDISVAEGEVVCVVGESGSGKTLTALSTISLLPKGLSLTSGQIAFGGTRIDTLDSKGVSRLRGNDISMIFQEPMTALDPLFTIGFQLREPLMQHRGLNKREATREAIESLRLCGLPSPELRVSQHPHELSGGMRQRVMIAMAMSCRPKLLLADEPTTALDVTVQAEILRLLMDLRKRFGTGVLFVTHDMGVVAEIADRVIVMKKGRVVEAGTVTEIFDHPQTDYTRNLLSAAKSIAP